MKISITFSFLSTLVFPAMSLVSFKEDRDIIESLAAKGHPMYHTFVVAEEAEHSNRMLQTESCVSQVVAVKTSEYSVDFKNGDFQYGITPIYRPGDLVTKVGDWWWEWAVTQMADGVYRSYGTMMIEFNERESITFGYSYTQRFYPMTGGYLDETPCLSGYAVFLTQEEDVRRYKLNLCGTC